MKAANKAKFFILAVLTLFLVNEDSVWAFPDEMKFSFAVSGGASELALTPNGRYMAVLPASGTNVTIVDTSYFTAVVSFSLSAEPTGLAAAEDSSGFFVTTNASDGLLKIELSGEPAEFVANQFDVSIDNVFIDVENTGSILLLLDEDETTVHLFDTDLETINESDSFTLSFESSRLQHFDNLSRALALGSDGVLGAINTSSFSQTGSTLDLSTITSSSTKLFQTLTGGSGLSSTVGFAANSTTPGEVVAFTVNAGPTPIVAIDADPSTTDKDPIVVADSPVAMLFTEVNNPEDSELSSDFYLYVASQADNTLSVIATEEFFDSDDEIVAPFTTIELSSTPQINGLAGNVGTDGYIYAATAGGSINVITENPLITFTTPAPSSVSSEDFTFGFTSDITGSYQVRRNDLSENGAINASSGDSVASGNTTADIETTITVDIDILNDGENLFSVFVGENGRNGFITTANPPLPAPENFALDFGDQRIFVSFRTVEGDVESYNIHFGTSETSLTGASGLVSPISVEHSGEANQKITEILEPIANGQTIFVQVAAVNSSGEEGEATEILSESTEETIGLLDLLAEQGGCSQIHLNSKNRSSFISLLLFAGLLLWLRRNAKVNSA
jgi:hypothetical protein